MENPQNTYKKRPKVQQKFDIKSEKIILISNYGTLFDLAFYNNCEEVICSGNDHEISFWNLLSGKKTLVLKGHTNTITKITQSPYNELQFVSTSSDKTVKIWNLTENENQEQNKFSYEQFTIENPDNKTTIGVVYISENQIVFGQCQNKAYFYDIKQQQIVHTYEFNVQNLQNLKSPITEGATIVDSTSQDQQQNQEKIEQKPKQSWVTELAFHQGKLILCENSRLHFINVETKQVETIFENTHSGHILSFKQHNNFILLGSSDSYAYLYEYNKDSNDLKLLLKIRAHTSAIATVDFWWDASGQESKFIKGLPEGGIMGAAFDPILKFYTFQGKFIFQVDDVASPTIWNSERGLLVGRDHNITREIQVHRYINNPKYVEKQ